MSKLTETCGKFISLYEGSGKLNQQDCEFEVGQQPDGTIIAYCVFSDWPRPVNLSGIELCGWTNDGIKVFGKGPLQNQSPNIDGDTETHYIHYGFWKLTVGEPDWSDAHSIKFAITNFLFCGNDEEAGGRGNCYNALKLKLDGLNVSFQKVADYYDKIYNSVISGDKIEVTCELTIEVAGRSKEEILKVASSICDLLTIAKGRKINWINYKVYDVNSSIIFTSHQSRRTDPNNGFKLINFEQARIAITYLQQCYPAYVQFDTQYPTMLNGVASMIFDSNATRFTLSRALVMFSVVDALGKKIIDRVDKSNDKKPGKFIPIKEKICALKTSYKVCLTDDEIGYFVKSRNSVVHELKFHTNDTIKEYEKCYHIFHRLLLRILDYQSEYFDITLQRRYKGNRINILRPCP